MANDSEIRSIMTLSSKSEASVTHGLQANYFNTPLHERCTIQDMEKLKIAFKEAYRQKMFFTEFRTLLRDMLNVEYTDEEYKILFLKINTNRNGEICWDELVSHLLLGYFANDPENQRETLEPPIMGLPKVMRSMHRHPISRICFCPDVSKDRSTDPLQGSYITASRDGMVSWWSLNMTRIRYGFSTSPHLKVRTTWVTDMVCMPDVNIIVTSSTERDLRFYDSTAGNFTLKIVITSWEYMICTMYYKFYQDMNEKCMLICGDVGGNVRVLQFSPVSRGPFQNQAARALIMLRHIDMVKRPQLLSQLQLIEFPRVHTDWVRQVSFYTSLHCVVSCATCPDSLLMCDVGGSKTHNMFRVEKGVQCFAFEEESHVLVTGGPDCAVRVWNPFVPSKASVTLYGHHAGIVALVLQRGGQTIYSLGRDRVIKVWDVQAQICIQEESSVILSQTYVEVPPQVGERTPITAVYNTATREFIMAAIKIAIITLDEQLNPQHTDGSTHSRAVSKILYNPLFRVVITCGMDSIIINWNPVTGKRNVMVRDAHTRMLHGELIPVEITAACFDSAFLLLLTGARNGTLKMWNFNSGVCLRNMSIEHMMEVTSVFWTDGRIFAIGWNKRVIEFDEGGIAPMGKPWETRHNDDVLAAAVRPPLTIATASYTSELIFWKLETGQPYRRFSCTEPMLRIKMSYNKRDLKAPQPTTAAATAERSKVSVMRRQSAVTGGGAVSLSPVALEKARARRVSTVSMPARAMSMRSLAVHAMMFLETRPHAMHIASLVLALENGQVQMWSDHPAGGFQGSFQGIHTTGDYVSAFATDNENKYLISGTTFGYIKVWLMTNYATTDKVHINMPELRVQFPFMWRDRIEGRAKRCVRDQPLPVLCNSYRGHMRCITTMGYINDQKIVLSGSSDYSVRLWRLSGEYLQTLGSFVPWTLQQTRFPPDVRKVASFTTFKVWRGGEVSRYVPGQVEVDKLRDITESELKNKTYGAPCEEPLLGHYLELPRRADRQEPIVLDDSLPTIPLYTHLRMASTQPVRRPPTPELVCQTRLKKGVVRKTHFTPGSAPSQMAAPAAAEPSTTAAAASVAGAAPAPAAGAPAPAAAPAAEPDGQPPK